MEHSPNYAASHKYDVKRVHKDGAAPERQPVSANALGLYGFNPIPAGGAPVTNEMVNKLREQSGI